ncbi:hypothetical protein CesoFtcFv8_016968 [Champsocephalus esox]|uniref:Alkylated DNA repair protein AlkB homologue 8 N-terminal domain-containing protein n=1 Tax=Champsocephalus esox TaxID=159716 RepID=A0AAN8BJ81_9TELE|nr:hypothetical protein CesoFtcFv8_016968 [Champsocephalus esox]
MQINREKRKNLPALLGVHLDNGLNWRINTVYKKGMTRLYFLRKLRSFHVCSKMLEIFSSVVASALFFAAVCWGGGSIRAGDTSRINKLIRKAGSVIGIKLDPFEAVVERRTLNRLRSIMDNPRPHPLHLQLSSIRPPGWGASVWDISLHPQSRAQMAAPSYAPPRRGIAPPPHLPIHFCSLIEE